MKVITAFTTGGKRVAKSMKLLSLIYLLNIILALFVAIPLHSLLVNKLGHSMEIKNMLPSFDYTVYSDFLNEYGIRDAFPTLMDQSQLLVFCFFVLSVFLTGGILNVYKNPEQTFNWSTFWVGCALYFWRLLRLSIYFILIHIGIFLFFYFILSVMTKGFNVDELAHEGVVLDSIQILLPFYLLVAAVFFMISDYAKIHMVHLNERWLFKPIRNSFKIGLNNFLKTYPLYLLNVLVFLFILVIYWFGCERIDASTAAGIFLLFVLGQLFVLGRIGVRLLKLATQTEMYRGIGDRM